MSMLDQLFAEARRTYRVPRSAAQNVLNMEIPKEVLVPALICIVAISVVARTVLETYFQIPSPVPPLVYAVFFGFFVVLQAYFTWKIGQSMNGKGDFYGSLKLGVFLQWALLPAVLVLPVMFAIANVLAQILLLALVVFIVWINLCFIDVLHKFHSLMRSFGVLLIAEVIAMVAALIVLSVLSSFLGIDPVEGSLNV